MGQGFLIDSNALIGFLSGKLSDKGMEFMNDIINRTPNISVITKIEVLSYNTTSEAYRLLLDFIRIESLGIINPYEPNIS